MSNGTMESYKRCPGCGQRAYLNIYAKTYRCSRCRIIHVIDGIWKKEPKNLLWDNTRSR